LVVIVIVIVIAGVAEYRWGEDGSETGGSGLRHDNSGEERRGEAPIRHLILT